MSRLLAGDRRVWIAGGAVLAAGLLLVLVYLLQSEERYTGTNSVGTRSVVAEVPAGKRLCIRGLRIPEGTARAQLSVVWPGEWRPEVRVERRGGGERFRATVPAAQARGPELPVPLEVPIGEPEPGPAAICLAPRGRSISLAGNAGLPGGAVAPLLGGERVGGQVAVRFLPPAGEETTRLAALGDAASRAALFRPGVVAPWWYWAIFLALLPALWVASLRLLATRAAGEGRARRAALAVAAIAALNAAAWALITPAWQGPDEPDHYAYAQSVAERGETPDKAQGDRPAFSTQLTVELDGTNTYAVVGLGDARPPWLKANERRLERRLSSAETSEDDGGGFLFSTSSHLPGYYLLSMPAYVAGDSSSVFSQLTLMRLVSALLAGVAALCAFLTVLELAPRRQWLAVAAGLIVAFQPMVAYMFGVYNNDAGANALAALLVLLLVRGLRRGPTVPLMLGLGVTLVALPAMKATGAALYPAAAVGIAGMLWRHRLRLPAYAALVVSAGAAFLARGAIVDALDAPSVGAGRTAGGATVGGTFSRVLDDLGTYFEYSWQMFLPRLPFMTDLHVQKWPAFDVFVEGGWGAFGWLVVRFPQWVYVVIALVAIAAAIACAAAVWQRRRGATRALGWELAVLVLAVAGVIAGVEAAYFTGTPRGVPAEQGRYAFTAIVPLAAVAAGAALAFRARAQPLVAAGLATAVIVLGYASQLLTLTWFFA